MLGGEDEEDDDEEAAEDSAAGPAPAEGRHGAASGAQRGRGGAAGPRGSVRRGPRAGRGRR